MTFVPTFLETKWDAVCKAGPGLNLSYTDYCVILSEPESAAADERDAAVTSPPLDVDAGQY
jgi:hypothetical protein